MNRYEGEGICSSIGRKHIGCREVEKEGTDTNDLDKKVRRKGIDSVDSKIEECNKLESDEESCTGTISNSTEEEPAIDHKESNVDNEEESVSNHKGSIVDDEELSEKVDDITPAAGVKRKFPTSFVDSIINKSSEDELQPKIKFWNTSFLESRDNMMLLQVQTSMSVIFNQVNY